MTTLLLRPGRDKKAYRLRCRFKIEPHPSQDRLDREKFKTAELFIRDMQKQGWENHSGSGFVMKGPFPRVVPTTLHPRHIPTAREMLPGVARGERFLDPGVTGVSLVPSLSASEWWEYELAGVFIRTQIMTERPDAHEEDLRS